MSQLISPKGRMPVKRQAMWWGATAIIFSLVMWVLGPAILPFIVAAGVAYLMDPLADKLEARGLSRTKAVALITGAMVIVLTAILLVAVPLLVKQASALIALLPAMITQAHDFVSANIPATLPEGMSVQKAVGDFGPMVSGRIARIVSGVLSSVGGLFSVMAFLVIVPVVAFYLLMDWDKLVARVDDLLPREHAPAIRRLFTEIDDALSGFVRGQLIVIAIMGTFYSLTLMAAGLPFGFFIGITAALLSFIPFVGMLIGGAMAIGVALFSFWATPFWILAVVVIFAIGQIVEGNYLQPKIVGGHVGLHPVFLLLALSVFGGLFGFTGLVIGVPLAAILGVLARFGVSRYRESPLYTGQDATAQLADPVRVVIVQERPSDLL